MKKNSIDRKIVSEENRTSLYEDITRSKASAPEDNKFLLTVKPSVRELIPNGSPIGSNQMKSRRICDSLLQLPFVSGGPSSVRNGIAMKIIPPKKKKIRKEIH